MFAVLPRPSQAQGHENNQRLLADLSGDLPATGRCSEWRGIERPVARTPAVSVHFHGQFQRAGRGGLARSAGAYRWPKPQAGDGLEIYLRQPERVVADLPKSFAGLESLMSAKPAVTVSGPGTIRVDFGCENAGWFEIDSPDCPGDLR